MQKKLDYFALSRARPSRDRVDVALCQGAQPTPLLAQKATHASNNFWHGLFAGDERPRHYSQK